ncbi:MAG: arsenite methyltransferase [Chloroflexota bacterium]|nr:MAG: arsenite methyltransferase [Chloroflexota bacterium]
MAPSSSTDRSRPSDEEIKQAVRGTYAQAISRRGDGCCGSECSPAATRPDLTELAHYTPEQLSQLPADAVDNAFGCGNPLSFAGVRPGDVVLDIGSGAGIDVLLAAGIVGPAGKVIGLDFTPEMIARATQNASRASANNVEFRLGDAEQIPVDDASVDWVISNCVINLAPDKRKVFAEIARVLKPGGRVSISDIVAGPLPTEVRSNLALWANCVVGAIEEEEYLQIMREAGLDEVQVASRQYYDKASVLSLVSCSCTSDADRQQLQQLADRYADVLEKIWSAKIVARKPA